MYNSNLIKQILDRSGTPLHPEFTSSVYLYELFNEDFRSPPISEAHWGLFYGNSTPVYLLHVSWSGTFLANDTTNQTYCISTEGTETKTMQSALDWACGPGRANCANIQAGKNCYQPDGCRVARQLHGSTTSEVGVETETWHENSSWWVQPVNKPTCSVNRFCAVNLLTEHCKNKEIFLKPKASKVPLSMLTDKPTQKSIPVAIKNPKFASPMVPKGGFVKDVAYMVMDDQVVKPLSTIFILNLLNQYDVKESAALQGKEVYLGMDEESPNRLCKIG
ncbi:glucan endo-1 [Abeliophyllum distichum]|uniref:Glucan endo-1 n=1 Tax=Abeliophyllum distichum TaxID=126358 RepID=A0ABD1UHM8_9LAMI